MRSRAGVVSALSCCMRFGLWMVLVLAANSTRGLDSVYIADVPHVLQKPDFCGEACVEMYLRKLGKEIDQDFVFDQSGLDPVEGRGCYTPELVRALRRIGFSTGNVWWEVSAQHPQLGLNWLFAQIHSDLRAGVPSILCTHYDEAPDSPEHFRLVLGYDAERDEVIYHEPAIRAARNLRMKRERLFQLWPLKYDQDQWTVVRIRLEPRNLTSRTSASQTTAADYAQHVRYLKKTLAELRKRQGDLKEERQKLIEQEEERERKLLAEGKEYTAQKPRPRVVSEFSIVIEEPFVVIGDDAHEVVSSYAAGTIRWAVDRLKQDYFPRDPDQILNVWLFKDEESYQQNVFDIFGTRPHTPFGYYSRWRKALLMDVSTGGGTLVHEIVHPFMEANFSECPAWLNEGMGSLFEQCHDVNGRIRGLTNWRLRGLQKALEKERKDREDEELEADERYTLPTFEQLCNTTQREFYNRDPGTHYAQSRYLCYYLQERGLLTHFFHRFRQSVHTDRGGYRTLQEILEVDDMLEFEQEWKQFVLQLTFP